MSRRIRCTLGILLLAAGGCAGARYAAPEASDDLIALERTLLHLAIVEGDPGFFEEVALGQFVGVAPGGVVEGRDEAAHGEGPFDARGITVTDERVSFAGRTAVLVGRLEIDGEMSPVGRPPPLRIMSVYVREAGRWRLLSRSLTPCFPSAVERGLC